MKISVQLYTVRDVLAKDPAPTLAAIGQMGFKYVETAGYAGKTPKEFKQMLNDSGLKCSGMHVSYEACEKEMARVLDEAALLGSKYVIVPGIPGRIIEQGWDKVGMNLQAFGEQAAKERHVFAYHNHAHEFETKVGDKTAYDVLFSAACPDYVKCQVDLWWAYYGHVDPAKLLERYGKRVRLVHLKDGKGRGNEPQAEAGNGVMDWDTVLKACDRSEVEFGSVELDECPRPPLESIKISLDFFRSKGYRG